MSMVEIVAKAIAQADEQNGGPPYEYRITLSKHAKEQLFDQARAAIAAMRIPTEAMADAGWNAGYEGDEHWENADPMVTYHAMIDEALNDSP